MDAQLQTDGVQKIMKFTPPLYKQRHQFIKQFVSEHKPKKVADLGCADCKLLWMLKFCNCIEVLVGLDNNVDVMKEKMHTLSPLPGDYLQPSERSLTVILYQGSVAHKDPCMLGFDLVTCIELIEHLEAKELEKFPEVVFGFMSPAMVIISTPNFEFNPLLPAVTLFRHPDHKFEWNRAQFQKWAIDTAVLYDYTVEFTGLGAPPPGHENVGFCTQIGVFVRKHLKHQEADRVEISEEHAYKTVFKVVYPSLKDEKYLQHAVIHEVVQTTQIIARQLLDNRKSECKKHCDDPTEKECRLQPSDCFLKYLDYQRLREVESKNMEPFINGNTVSVPLALIFSFPKVHRLCSTFETLSKLIAGKVELSNDGTAVIIDDHEEHNN